MGIEPQRSFRLSKEQKRIVQHRNGHLQVIACAGSGKTEAISCRIATLIAEGTLPSKVVAFTFTERAAESLKTRIIRRVGERMGTNFLDRLGPTFIGTIHAFCMRMLQDHVPTFASYDVLDDHRHAGLLSREHSRIGLNRLGNRHWGPIQDFLRNAEVVENELIDYDRFSRTPFGRCYKGYLAMLNQYHFLTYGQLIAQAVQALKDPSIYDHVHGSLRHLIVDEYQDINPAQERLIRLLARNPVHLCVVGDDDQAIYQWRGSTVENILTFRKRYKKADSRPLTTNRRSRPRIIATANGFSASIHPRLPKKMKEYRPSSRGPEVQCWSAATPEDEAEVISNTITSLVKYGFRLRDIGILLRSVRTSSPPIIGALQERNIPFRCAGRTGLFLQSEVRILGQTYAWLSDNMWKHQKYGDQEEVHLKDLLQGFQKHFRVSPNRFPRLKTYLEKWYAAAHNQKDPANLVGDYYRLLKLLRVDRLDLANPAAAARMGSLARFSQLLADFEHIKRRSGKIDGKWHWGQDRGLWLYKTLFNYLQFYAMDAYEDFDGEETFESDAVDLLTIHQAKGLEWPVVFVPCLVEGRFPSRFTGKSQDWLISSRAFPREGRRRYEGSEADERRLLYVAMTRARDMLYLSRFQRKKNHFRASRFFMEVAKKDPEPVRKLRLPNQIATENEDTNKISLSFSEVAAYENCPLSYRLSSLLGFQPQLAIELGYGKAVHQILRRIADFTRDHHVIPNTEEMEDIFQEEFYLPFAHQAAYDELCSAARKLVDRYLSKYREDLFRTWETERPFELHLEHGNVAGRADVILDQEDRVSGSLALVDYKTARYKESENLHEFQLAIYAAAGKGEGLAVRAAYLHDLKEGERSPVPVNTVATAKARHRADQVIAGIQSGKFDAKPEKSKCSGCDFRFVCSHGPAR